jgi:hypothetical protein
MAFTDPQSVTINAIAIPLPRTSVEEDKSEYTSSDGLVKVTASHDVKSRVRRLIRIDHSKLTADPFKPAENVKVSMSCYIVFDIPPAGYASADVMQVYSGFKTWYTASSDAIITKLLGGES